MVGVSFGDNNESSQEQLLEMDWGSATRITQFEGFTPEGTLVPTFRVTSIRTSGYKKRYASSAI